MAPVDSPIRVTGGVGQTFVELLRRRGLRMALRWSAGSQEREALAAILRG